MKIGVRDQMSKGGVKRENSGRVDFRKERYEKVNKIVRGQGKSGEEY